ncbi:hypothetical protein SOCEGT47_044480 [Sorangium cellulosum]|uniref:Uncharacterized protein n=2 Tax=Sorangium cellulosum TaxID=56 RepID=A0A4P2Q4J0_SORCE|nr:hypothetical protein SOCEGT47_044480 [Sorangium cellulosum]
MWMRLLPVLSLALAGCGPAPEAGSPAHDDIFSAAGPSELIVLTAQGELVSADFEPGRVLGPDVSLSLHARDDGSAGRAIRGIAFGRTVSVTADDQGATGVVGAAPLALSVTRADTGLRARGLVAGALSDYRLDERQLTGVIGRCSYELTRVGRVYEGSRRCGDQPHRVTVLLPRALPSWSDAARAATLGLLLGM